MSPIKSADTFLYISNNQVNLFNKSIDIDTSTYSHYKINILPDVLSNFHNYEQVLIFEQEKNLDSTPKKLKILQKVKLKITNIHHLMKIMVSQCDNCNYTKSTPRPIVSISKQITSTMLLPRTYFM